MAISSVCKDRRKEDGDLKTQLRYGTKDIEVHIKYRGSGEGFRKTNLREFMGEIDLPSFYHTVRWRKRKDRLGRRITNYRKTGRSEEPATGKEQEGGPTLIRQRSETKDTDSKRARIEDRKSSSSSSGSSGDDTNDSDVDMTSGSSASGKEVMEQEAE